MFVQQHKSAIAITEFFTVNQSSVQDFLLWVKAYNAQTGNILKTNASFYTIKKSEKQLFKVISKTEVSEDHYNFKITLQPKKSYDFVSGNILSVFRRDNDIGRQFTPFYTFPHYTEKSLKGFFICGKMQNCRLQNTQNQT